MKKLGDAELEIMLSIWSAGEPVPSSYVQEKLRGSRDWALPAILTSLSRLVDKGFLACEKRGKSNWYRPLISERDYKTAEGRGSSTASTAAASPAWWPPSATDGPSGRTIWMNCGNTWIHWRENKWSFCWTS